MSIEKQGAFLDRLSSAIKARRDMVAREVRKAHGHHASAARDQGFSLTSWVLDPLANNDAMGAKTLRKGYRKLQYGISQVDTGLGALARGNAKQDSFRHKLFTQKSYVPARVRKDGTIVPDFTGKPNNSGLKIEVSRPSISKPVQATAGLVTTGLALSKADELVNNYYKKKGEVPR